MAFIHDHLYLNDTNTRKVKIIPSSYAFMDVSDPSLNCLDLERMITQMGRFRNIGRHDIA